MTVRERKPYANLPETPGVYIMEGRGGKILYIGKAGNLKRRVSSYFVRPHDYRIEKLLSEVKKINYRKTDTAIEALILESQLIKKHKPPYNIREKDDKSFLSIEITNEKFPRALLVRGKGKTAGERFGPFTSASNIREAMRILRRIFPYSVHSDEQTANRKSQRACFDYQIGLCPGTCIGAINRRDYLRNIRNLKLFLRGKKKKIANNLQKEMRLASRKLEFEKAEKIRRQIFALQHIQDIALLTDSGEYVSCFMSHVSRYRIEGYDVSNISGTSAVGSMVAFRGDTPDRNEYRRFRIRTITQSDDIGMFKEMLRRRFRHREWPLPYGIVIDGGRGQVNAAKAVLDEFGLKIPVVGIAKGSKRKKNEFVGTVPKQASKTVLLGVRDEAHRFALSYHRQLRGKTLVP